MPDLSKRKDNDFTPLVYALHLVEHVLKITENQKRFPDYKISEKALSDGKTFVTYVHNEDGLVNDVCRQAKDIYIKAFAANQINVKRQPGRAQERLQLQAEAIRLCDVHLATIQICAKRFHLRGKQVKYWGQLVVDTRGKLIAWHEADTAKLKCETWAVSYRPPLMFGCARLIAATLTMRGASTRLATSTTTTRTMRIAAARTALQRLDSQHIVLICRKWKCREPNALPVWAKQYF